MHSKFRFHRITMGVLMLAAGAISLGLFGCDHGTPVSPSSSDPQVTGLAKHGEASAQEKILVADLGGFSPIRIDANLLNAWGIAINPNGKIWIAANHSGLSVVYDQTGAVQRPPVTIPLSNSPTGGAPTGVVFNPTSAFVIPGTGEVSKFIFASEDGIISAWSSGSGALVAADRSSSDAVYKGLALATDGGKPFLYATNFKGGKVDVFDDHFQYVTTKPFNDPQIPAGFAPFNIESIDGFLYVTYAKQKGPDNMDDQSGPGNGYIDIYKTDGSLVGRFASQGTLNSPWGMAQVPEEGAGRLEHAILVGNFGDGRISVFSREGKFQGQLSDAQGSPLTIHGLWALSFNPNHFEMKPNDHSDMHHGMGDLMDGGDHKSFGPLFFTAGPNDENDGVFGYLSLMK